MKGKGFCWGREEEDRKEGIWKEMKGNGIGIERTFGRKERDYKYEGKRERKDIWLWRFGDDECGLKRKKSRVTMRTEEVSFNNKRLNFIVGPSIPYQYRFSLSISISSKLVFIKEKLKVNN